MNDNYSQKKELLHRIDSLSENTQKCLFDLICHKFLNMPLKYEESPVFIELQNNNFIKRAVSVDDYMKMSISELESCLYLIEVNIECELTKKELIEIIMQHKDKLSQYYIPVLNFNLQKAAQKHLSKKLGLDIL